MDAILDRFFEMTRDLACIAGFDGLLKRVNPAWTHKLQYEAAELVGRPYLDLYHPDDRELIRERAASVARGTPLPMVEARLRRRDGEYLSFLWSATAIVEHQVLVAVAKDITERRRMEDALRDSELRFRSVTECAVDAIVTADELGNIQSWNRAAHLMFGYSADEVHGRSLTILMPERYRAGHLAGMARFLGGAPPQAIGRTIALHGLHRDGREFALELSLSTWSSPGGGRHFAGFLRDLSGRKG